MDAIRRRLQSLTLHQRSEAQARALGLFGAWQAIDDDPVLLCECGDEDCGFATPPAAVASRPPAGTGRRAG